MDQSDLTHVLPEAEQFFRKYVNRHVETLISASTQLSDTYLKHREEVILKQKATTNLLPELNKRLQFLKVIEASFENDNPNETIEGMSKIQIAGMRSQYEQLIADHVYMETETEQQVTINESLDSSIGFVGKQMDQKGSIRWDLYALRGLEVIGAVLPILLLAYQLLK